MYWVAVEYWNMGCRQIASGRGLLGGKVHGGYLVLYELVKEPDDIVVLWLLYPYRIITLDSYKHNRDDTPWRK